MSKAYNLISHTIYVVTNDRFFKNFMAILFYCQEFLPQEEIDDELFFHIAFCL